jgi:hypothetical protein
VLRGLSTFLTEVDIRTSCYRPLYSIEELYSLGAVRFSRA